MGAAESWARENEPSRKPTLDDLFPPAPSAPPAELTAASAAYKRSAWLACAGLFGFVAVYLGLIAYLARVVYRLLGNAILHGGNVLLAGALSLPALFFIAFLVRGLFVVKHAKDPSLVELDEHREPLLFAFLRRLADETGAPRPHRVFVSARVNASVFYDLSFWNLIFPSKKNLELGLGLVNALTLDELKAVIAHEYGHFAQRTMAVGRWVYVAQQIAGHIIVSRGVFDRFLSFISNIDIRVAWIGWIMRLFVWAIRSVLDTVFRVVVLAHRALGREMELQADRVAVSVSGSDSLVHALHRLGPADEAWEEAIAFIHDEAVAGRPVSDLFSVQSAALEHLRRILSEPGFGLTPERPQRASSHRVFDSELAQPPRMWMTHPPNREREEHAKAIYLGSALDPRPAWALFADPETLRRDITRSFLALLFAKIPNASAEPVPTAQTLARFEERFARASLDPRYRGAYLGRAIAAYHESPELMVSIDREDGDRDALVARFDALYPSSLGDELAKYRERREEESLLEGLSDGVLSAPGGVIRYRGREIPRKELASVIEGVRSERREIEARILEHDRACRAVHLDAARLLGQGWEAYLESLHALLHYATHAFRDLADAHGHLHHVLRIVLADGSVSNDERVRVLAASNDLQHVLEQVWSQKPQLVLPPAVRARFADLGGFTVLEDSLGMNDPHPENLGDWLQKVDGWAAGASGDLKALADATLDALLDVEEAIARQLREGIEPGDAPEPARVPERYRTCVVGAERERQKKLGWWDRFQTADGFLPGAARFAVASALLLPALLIGGRIGGSTVHVFNGLPIPVVVSIDGDEVDVGAHGAATIDHDASDHAHVITTTRDGRVVEDFEASVGGGFADYAYNVAHATVLVQWTAVYGPGAPPPERVLGAPRWRVADEDAVFEAPPTSVSVSSHSSSARRTVLEAVVSAPPGTQLSALTSDEERLAMMRAHVLFDPIESASIGEWVAFASQMPAMLPVLRERAQLEPGAVLVARALQDAGDPEVCPRATAGAAEQPDDADLAYLAARCMTDPEARRAAYARLYAAHPENGWTAFAVAHDLARASRWQDALVAWSTAVQTPALRGVLDYARTEMLRTQRGAALHHDPAGAHPFIDAPDGSGGMLDFFLRIEGLPRDDDPPAFAAYRRLASGAVPDAVQSIDMVVPEVDARAGLVALAAASDGATGDLVQRGLAIDPASLGPAGLHALAALAIREHRDPSPYLAPLRASDDERVYEGLAELLASPALAEDPAALEAIAARAMLGARGHVLAMGVIVLGDRAPASWREQVRALLFAPERPYFR
ncbi:M48 family metallopeptidase [Sandaracinus amylolyticus]|uniref:M48 family metallopeptidase n=1 Tax=Sandaracinus amylolyticus TaxID=927083 RepID=UPI001F18BF6B|nr:M48 family metallopeptidase [Sandaracinus amylolyticus]UJR78446.1 Zn-dependent protease with chaperone function [Sandaracinus amylolyticus]